ncbi:asparagine synthase (glutamine-hydrolyzing) [Prosthecobacter sp.]|uniref:asparagine synthase (glutamine-hydrolyzing) n=1 Tax=Prosthecobacter sp. TaxID=1965333 RepID=UPI002ABBA3E0|nr:asparagine synthase (glutamine-hydrolyzing) [Prosthecobacter sp.]MDZ4401083.1 asparagine synthase (glutamine-hydrolyzing) [Prosthecobacter sp.]
MCGIAGYFNLNGAPAEAAVLARMIDIQRHRGPDDQGIRLFSLRLARSHELKPGGGPAGNAFEGALGFNRLSIQDLSELGHQPMLNGDGSIILAFNGEIYNAPQHRRDLEASGCQFRSHTDTEVILKLYETHGFDGMLGRLNGMFVIVIIDLRQGEIHIARDHLGIKPFYWTMAGQALLFASEAKSFLMHPAFKAEVDTTHLDEYLAFRYVAGENYLLKGVRQLRPGHCLRITAEGVSVRRYWEIPDGSEQASLTDDEALDKVDHLLRQAVKSQLISDVPVGCQLSGGIDSSLVSVFARSHFDADMQTFSVVFDDPGYSEEHWMSQAANAAKADSHRFMFSDGFFFETLDRASWHLDQPLNHPNSLGIWLLARRARPLVTVLLSGEGADEIFGGYSRFYYAGLRPKVSPWLPLLRRAPKIGMRLERQFGGNPVDSFIGASLWQRSDLLLQLRPEADFENLMSRRRVIFAEGQADHLGNCLKYEMQTYMVDLLVRQDKMTMAHSLENRVPFLDLDLMACARSLPRRCLVSPSISLRDSRMRATKVVLKRLARRTFDEKFVYRRKSGFSLPLEQYFADKRFESLMEDRLLPGMKQRGLVNADVVRRWWKDLPHLPPSMAETLWIPVALELWAQQFIDASTTQTALT